MQNINQAAPDYDNAEPRADCMIQSMRAFGYDLPAAVADIIDNSISADANNIWLDFHWNGEESRIAVSDDGYGMNSVQLLEAMRPGSRSPLETRNVRDLGRFGLGLKTASFSQCKKLTVGSKNGNAEVSVRCWDLDYVTACSEWRLLKQGSDQFQKYGTLLTDLKSGTIVLWERLDRVTAHSDVNNQKHHELFLSRIDKVKQHVAMVFHRFLEGPRAIKIWLNATPIKPWDPFLSRETATQLLTEEAVSIFGTHLEVKPFVLPYRLNIDSSVYQLAAGPRGWNSQQGFYVYRNKRLLVAGDWLGLGFHKEEHHNLARIMLDIPNSMDAEWEIDVKKCRASPPPAIRSELKRLAQITRKHASQVYKHRGARIHQSPVDIVFLWEKLVRHKKVSYVINREHPLVKGVIETPGDLGRKIQALLNLIEETVPVPTIAIDNSETPSSITRPFEYSPSALEAVMRETYKTLRQSGYTQVESKIRIASLELFNEYPELIAALDDYQGECS